MRQNIISGAGGIKRLPEQLTAMGGKRPLLDVYKRQKKGGSAGETL